MLPMINPSLSIVGRSSGIYPVAHVYSLKASLGLLSPEVETMIRSLACLALLLIPSGVATAQEADRTPVVYEDLQTTDPRAALLWSNVQHIIARAKADGSSDVLVRSSTFPTSAGGSFVVQVLTGGGTCGLKYCSARISENGVPIAEFPVCVDLSTHAISLDGTKFFDCGGVHDLINPTAPRGLGRVN